MEAAQSFMAFFSSVATLTKSSFTLNASVKFSPNIESASDLTNVTFSKIKSDILAMISLKRGTGPLNKSSTLSTTVSYPIQGKPLLSLIGIVNFYHGYTLYFEIRLNPLRKCLEQYYHKPILLMVWTP